VPAAAAQLVDLLVLDQLDLDLFLGRQPDTDRQRVFGGQVAAQALMATIRTVDPAYVVHSLHSYFLLPGDTAVPIIYDVQRLRDGRSFGTRRVVARQHGRPIFYLTANFQRPEEGLEHQDVMPEVIPPEEAVDFLELMRSRGTDDAEALAKEWAALDVRFIGSSRRGLAEDPAHPARARLWMRVAGDLGEDAALHAAAFTYASDMTLLGAAVTPHDITLSSPGMQAASLDHALWFHRPFRADDWWLYDQVSPSASGGRGLSLAGVYAADGRRVATAAQEGLIRLRTTD
jgi:acyl-CoA thioesterase-2